MWEFLPRISQGIYVFLNLTTQEKSVEKLGNNTYYFNSFMKIKLNDKKHRIAIGFKIVSDITLRARAGIAITVKVKLDISRTEPEPCRRKSTTIEFCSVQYSMYGY